MSRWLRWIISGLIYSVIIFAFIYFFINFDIIPNLWEGYIRMFTIPNMIVLSVICGFIFSAITTFISPGKKVRR
ncbi:MAG: hypothetical protein ACP5NZ_00235 [Nanobdellota archaeon]